jgi:ADP-ribose diphosphatase
MLAAHQVEFAASTVMEIDMPIHTKPKILQQKIVAESQVFRVEQLELRFSNGEQRTYERLRGSKRQAVIIAPLQDKNNVLLIREYCAGVDEYQLALPKGLVEAGESVTAAANRELMEEVGYGAKQLELLKTFTVAPGYIGFQTHLILAQDLYAQRLVGDEPEEIEVVPWSLNALDELVQREDCTEARSIAALYMLRDRLRSEHL